MPASRLSISHACFCIATLAIAGAASAANFSITTPGANNTTAAGQNFSPSVGNSPNPGLAAGSPVSMTSFAFTKGSGGTGNAATRLVVLDGAFYDTNGGDGLFVPTTANAVAVSTNTIDTAAAADGASLNFAFSGATLTYGNNYTVAFATVGAGNALSFVPVNVKYIDYAETAPGSGVYLPTSNYGGTGNFNATALFPDFNGDGYFEADSNAADTAFVATFQTVPEPATLAALLLAAPALFRQK
jgi:hypothetical protein